MRRIWLILVTIAACALVVGLQFADLPRRRDRPRPRKPNSAHPPAETHRRAVEDDPGDRFEPFELRVSAGDRNLRLVLKRKPKR